MKRQYTVKELWAFVNRADTHERISIAENFLKKLDYLDNDVWNDMMEALALKSREMYHESELEDDYDEFFNTYNRIEDEDERRMMRMRAWRM